MRINANFNYIVAKRPAIFKVADFGIWEEYLRLMRQMHASTTIAIAARISSSDSACWCASKTEH